MIKQSKSRIDALIRIAVIEEAAPIASVLRQAFTEYEPLYTRAAFAATTPTASQLEERWREGPVWVAVLHPDIVGTVAAVSTSSGLYIRSMAILPAARGRGIASQLLREVERSATHRQHKRLFLSTTPFLAQAIRLYESFGFQRNEEGPDDLFGTPLFTMEKSLPSQAESAS
jgi:ribosomal protein S18 acetylase RimI-like enzyme